MTPSAEHWEAADKAYIAHHFHCPTCCAAGLSGGKQERCPEGLRLWGVYEKAGLPPPLQPPAYRNDTYRKPPPPRQPQQRNRF